MQKRKKTNMSRMARRIRKDYKLAAKEN